VIQNPSDQSSKVSQFFQLVGPIIVSMKSARYFCSNPAKRQTE